jgi:hypothetical protein
MRIIACFLVSWRNLDIACVWNPSHAHPKSPKRNKDAPTAFRSLLRCPPYSHRFPLKVDVCAFITRVTNPPSPRWFAVSRSHSSVRGTFPSGHFLASVDIGRTAHDIAEHAHSNVQPYITFRFEKTHLTFAFYDC